MPRSRPSLADQELLTALAEASLPCSGYRLERWRQHGLLPRTAVQHPGGGGSAATLDQETWERAALLAAHSARGVAWQLLGLMLLEAEYDLPQPVLRQCLTWLLDKEERSVAKYTRMREQLPLLENAAADELDLAEGIATLVKGGRHERAYFAVNEPIIRARYPGLKRADKYALVRSGMVWNVAERLGEELTGQTKALAQGWASVDDAVAGGFVGEADPARVLHGEKREAAATFTWDEYLAVLLVVLSMLPAHAWEMGFASVVVLRAVTQYRVALVGVPDLPLSEEHLADILRKLPDNEGQP